MLDVENEVGWLFLICTLAVYALEIGACRSVLKDCKKAKNILIGYNISSIASFCLLLALFAGGVAPVFHFQMECNGALALYGITWASSQYCFVRLISLLNEKKA